VEYALAGMDNQLFASKYCSAAGGHPRARSPDCLLAWTFWKKKLAPAPKPGVTESEGMPVEFFLNVA